MEEEFLSVKEFALLLHVHPNTIRRGIRAGRISCLRVGIAYRIPRTETNRLAFDHLEKVLEKLIEKSNNSKNDSDLCS